MICWAVSPLLLFVIWWRLSPSYDFGRWGGVLWVFFFSVFFRILLTNHVYKYAHTRWGGRWMWDQQDPVATEPQHPVSRKEPCHHVSHARRLLDCDQHPSGQSAHCYVQVIITVMFTWLWPFLWSICSLLCSDKYNSNVYLTDQYSSGQSAPFYVQLTMMSASTFMWLRCVCVFFVGGGGGVGVFQAVYCCVRVQAVYCCVRVRMSMMSKFTLLWSLLR